MVERATGLRARRSPRPAERAVPAGPIRAISPDGRPTSSSPTAATVHIRPIRPDDAGRLESFHERLSPESKYLRFFSPMPHLSATHARALRHRRLRRPLRARRPARRRHRRRGPLRRARHQPQPRRGGVHVDDAHQGRGPGDRSCSSTSPRWPPTAGITRFVAETLPGNNRMLAVFRAAGYGDERHFEGGTVQVTFPIHRRRPRSTPCTSGSAGAAAASVRRLLAPTVGGGGRRRSRSRAASATRCSATSCGPGSPGSPTRSTARPNVGRQRPRLPRRDARSPSRSTSPSSSCRRRRSRPWSTTAVPRASPA